MFTVKSQDLELRGIVNKSTANGKVYYLLNVEDFEGNHYSLYCPDFNALPQGLKKGDIISITFTVKYFQGNEKLIVKLVEKLL